MGTKRRNWANRGPDKKPKSTSDFVTRYKSQIIKFYKNCECMGGKIKEENPKGKIPL